jgi:hypothetical protein
MLVIIILTIAPKMEVNTQISGSALVRKDELVGHVITQSEKNVYNPITDRLEKQPTLDVKPIVVRSEMVRPTETFTKTVIDATTGKAIAPRDESKEPKALHGQ